MTNDIPGEPKDRPNESPWVVLATLYGKPLDFEDRDLIDRNRLAWNRYMASIIREDQKALLLRLGYPIEELTPFSTDELHPVQARFAERSHLFGSINPIPSEIDFSDITIDFFLAQRFFFPIGITFSGSTFSDLVAFAGAIFFETANFIGTTFSGPSVFTGASFRGVAVFKGATFSDLASFGDAIFLDRADFGGVTFNWVNFGGTIFDSIASFVNADMKAETKFNTVKFRGTPPVFFGAKLHEGTIWQNAQWPNPPINAEQASEFINAYEWMRLEMERLKKYEDELDFFALELQSRQVLLGFWRGLPVALYGFLCNYGRSYFRPLFILVASIIVGAIPFWAHFSGSAEATLANPAYLGDAIGFSFANTFGVLGIRKDLIDPEILKLLPGWLKVIATIQTGLGITLLFLFSLALRNRFRMK
jgi:uncharacterized protein YjbI with pentapeptide repeats